MGILESFVFYHRFLAYLIVFFGMFVEGDTFFLAASIFATERYLRWGILTLVTITGVITGDWLFYLLGLHSKNTRFGLWLMARLGRHRERVERNVMRHYVRLAFVSKFVYFLNRLTPFLAGWHDMPRRQFLKIHASTAIAWTGVMLIIGHIVGLLVEVVGMKFVLRRIEFVIVGFVILIFAVEYALKRLFGKKIEEEIDENDVAD